MPAAPLPADLRLGPVALTVSDLERSVAFYERALGLRLHARDGGRGALGAGGEDLLALVERPGAAPAGRHAGLYHFALLQPSRAELARALARVAQAGAGLEGASDHGVSEALYLRDPDGHGIELYVDRPRERWPAPRRPGARVEMFTVALDLRDLHAEAGGEPPPARADRGLVMGHVHLHVGDVARAVAFYAGALGFELMLDIGSAAFLAAGGYHHHLGVNSWLGPRVGPPPPGTAGLRRWTVLLAPAALAVAEQRLSDAGVELERDGDALLARDPWGTAVALAPA